MRSDEWLSLFVVVSRVALDGCLQVDQGMEGAAPDTFSGEHGAEAFGRVEPGTEGRRDMERPPWMAFQPSFNPPAREEIICPCPYGDSTASPK